MAKKKMATKKTAKKVTKKTKAKKVTKKAKSWSDFNQWWTARRRWAKGSQNGDRMA